MKCICMLMLHSQNVDLSKPAIEANEIEKDLKGYSLCMTCSTYMHICSIVYG